MSYMALYRKFRPARFSDVKGQDAVVTTLQNQIRADRIGHAYIFCGTRGTGKTTAAKIFGRAVNCEHPVDGSPCGTCKMCKAIADGTAMNVIEIDAASNNGVDNIRQIREEVMYRPAEGRYKVYIIDEAHMITASAFNALLKTLEEPPEYVIFILATTEVNKIPATILSRCQRYDFRRMDTDTIVSRMKELLAIEQVEAEDAALRYIARAADGSMRDALSLLDQSIAFYMDQKLTYDKVLEVLGAVDTDVYSRMLRCVIAQDTAAVLDIVDELVMAGKELTQAAGDFTWYLRNLLLVKASANIENGLDVSAENLRQLKEEAGMIEMDDLLRYIRVFSDLSSQLKFAVQKRVLLEVALIKLCTPAMETKQDTLFSRIRAAEQKADKALLAAEQAQNTAQDAEKNAKSAAEHAAKNAARHAAQNAGSAAGQSAAGQDAGGFPEDNVFVNDADEVMGYADPSVYGDAAAYPYDAYAGYDGPDDPYDAFAPDGGGYGPDDGEYGTEYGADKSAVSRGGNAAYTGRRNSGRNSGRHTSRGAASGRPVLQTALPEEIKETAKNFREIAAQAPAYLRGYLDKAKLSVSEDNKLLVVFPDAVTAGMVGRKDHVKELEELIERHVGKHVPVEVRQMEEGRRFTDVFVDLEDKIKMEITVEDE